MPPLVRLSPAEAIAALDHLLDAPWDWRPEAVDAYMAPLGGTRVVDDHKRFIRYTSPTLPLMAGQAVLDPTRDTVESVGWFLTEVGHTSQIEDVTAVYDEALAHLTARLGESVVHALSATDHERVWGLGSDREVVLRRFESAVMVILRRPSPDGFSP